MLQELMMLLLSISSNLSGKFHYSNKQGCCVGQGNGAERGVPLCGLAVMGVIVSAWGLETGRVNNISS